MENNDYMDRFSGISRLYGLEATALFQRSHICVIGIGGVGCWTVEALARLGIGELTLVDMDEVCINNSNRQLHAMDGEVGRPKVDVMGDRIRRINPQCKVNLINDFFMKSTAEEIMSTPYDYVVDCIDSVGRQWSAANGALQFGMIS